MDYFKSKTPLAKNCGVLLLKIMPGKNSQERATAEFL